MYLLTANLRIKKLSKKLNHVKVGPFLIKKVRESVIYELDLLKNIKIHSVFHIFLLKSANSITSIQKKFHFETQEEDKFEIEKILNYDDQNYLIH